MPILRTPTVEPTPLLTPKFAELFLDGHTNNYAPSRYKIAYGGRASGKSYTFTGMATVLATQAPIRVLCCREIQNSIRESVYGDLKRRISGFGLERYFDVQREAIYGTNGAEFIFAGIKNDPGKIRSTVGIDICLVEEAQNISEASWQILIPTIRPAQQFRRGERDPEIWILFNPVDENDATYRRFVIETPPECRRVKVNWSDNPFFPKVMELERQADLKRIANAPDSGSRAILQAIYNHIWEGEPQRLPAGAFFSEQAFLVEGRPVALPKRIDGVFAVIDTAMKTGREHDGLAVLYCGYALHGQVPHPLYLLDWDITQIEVNFLIDWLPSVYERLEQFARETEAFGGSRGVWIEDKQSGTVLIKQAQYQGWAAEPIESKLTSMGKAERCLNISGHIHAGEVKICGGREDLAYERRVVYHEKSRNHLMGQVLEFNPKSHKDMAEDDLLDCLAYAVAIALGGREGF